MRVFALFILLLILLQKVSGQNLITNFSFEDNILCPDNENEVPFAIGWESWCATPDYFNACAEYVELSVPSNWYGSYQSSESGNAYCGFYAFWRGTFPQINIRELISRELNVPLNIGDRYFVKARFSTAYNGFSAACACNHLGVKFTTNSFDKYATDSLTCPLINNQAQVSFNEIVSDTVNWLTLSGSFIADSAYQYIVIGNFFDDAHTDTFLLGNFPICRAYYYVDNVCVSTDSGQCLITEIDNHNANVEVFAYPNPVFDKLNVTILNAPSESFQVRLLNLEGCALVQNYFAKGSEIFLNTKNIIQGMYILEIQSSKFLFQQKILITH